MQSNKHRSILFIKNNKTNWTPATQQTQKIRNITNLKIRELGNKYFIVKGILDKLNIKRDTLFFIGKELENEYKNKKNMIHLQTQKRRMKEAIICWYSENFFTEITQDNSLILKRLLLFNSKYFDSKMLMNTITRKKFSQKFFKKAKVKIDNENSKLFDIFNTQNNNIITHDMHENNACYTNIESSIVLNLNKQINDNTKQDIHVNGQRFENNVNQICEKSIFANQNITIDDNIIQNDQISYTKKENSLEISNQNTKTTENTLFFTDVKINQEIDVFENGNMTGSSNNCELNPLSCFKF